MNKPRSFFTGCSIILGIILTLIALVVIEIPEMLLSHEMYDDPIYYSSALQFALEPIYYGGFILMVPLAAAIPYTSRFVNQVQCGNCYYAMIRSGRRRYICRELFRAFVQGGGSVACGFVIYAVLCNLFFTPSNPQVYEAHMLPFDGTIYEQMYQTVGGLPMYTFITSMIFLSAGCWALVAMTAAAWMPDSLIAITSPLIIYYIWLWSGIRSVTWLPFSVGPTQLFNDGLTLPVLLENLVQYTVLAICCILLFRAGIGRRIRNAQ